MIKSILPDNVTVEQVFKALETETTALFEHLEFSFLVDYPVFAPRSKGANTDSPATGAPEGSSTLLLPRYLRAASNGPRTPQRRRLTTVRIHASAGTADA